ncbi:hypothetical protein K7432_015962 [Basidiobolus ranarum]|uniref:Uncharacterized protein n=1 Tax=Basidiobolus ranarum TaxID=34480 RepID=A0ABR2WFH5_9FUNG
MDEATINLLLSIRKELNGKDCQLVVTGGTEIEPHGPTSAHATGRAVDIRYSDCVSKYFKSFEPYQTDVWKSPEGNYFYWEKIHWHVEACQTVTKIEPKILTSVRCEKHNNSKHDKDDNHTKKPETQSKPPAVNPSATSKPVLKKALDLSEPKTVKQFECVKKLGTSDISI